jgi:hypothetical protein
LSFYNSSVVIGDKRSNALIYNCVGPVLRANIVVYFCVRTGSPNKDTYSGVSMDDVIVDLVIIGYVITYVYSSLASRISIVSDSIPVGFIVFA